MGYSMTRLDPRSHAFVQVSRRRRTHLLVVSVVILGLLQFSASWWRSEWSRELPSGWTGGSASPPVIAHMADDMIYEPSELYLPRRHKREDKALPNLHVAVLEHGGFHDEVIGALVKVLDDVGVNFTVYRDGYRWGFDKVLHPFLPDLPDPEPRGSFGIHAEERKFDIVFHTSCDYTWRDRLPDWIDEAFVKNPNLQIVCIQHQLENLGKEERDVWAQQADEGRLRFMTLSPHVSSKLKTAVQEWAVETGNPVWGAVTVDTLVPIFPVQASQMPLSLDGPGPQTPMGVGNAIPANIAILGNIEQNRRNYQGIMRDLQMAILEDPEAWGYRVEVESGRFIPLSDSAKPPVKLHFVGEKPDWSNVDVPDALQQVVVMHSGLQYDDFYRLIGSMDLIVPAFVDFVYVTHKLSSAIPAGIIARVPILATPLHLEAYSFLRSPAIALHPVGMGEVEAIGLIRRGVDPMTFDLSRDPVLPGYAGPQPGTPAEWDAYHSRINYANGRMMKSLLADLASKVPANPVHEEELEAEDEIDE